ncbi:MAG: 3-dehydroquinate synthase [Firmicutes bacterium HGW-Firmicutes-15]|nr:MAG: 3-dehydroquinate synthase [Firmicutes bacterium HGW-Firmicutes-15]
MVRVELGERSYDICIGENWLPRLGDSLNFVPKSSQMIMISDENVFNLYGSRVLEILRDAGFKVESAVIAGGEGCKNLATSSCLYEQMITAGLDRKSTVLALGGGIVGDIAGFAAATYMRGIAYIQIPTTLLAQVDSSVGGKTGVNLPQGKNLVGAFYQPGLVFVDVAFIETLPEREYLTGLAEIIKYGIIWDKDFFKYLEEHCDRIKSRDSECLMHITSRCCSIKAEIVAQDETESGLRALLNLGHTFGHAFEALTNYQMYTHGEAVAVGMIYAARLAHHLGIIPFGDLNRIANLIKFYGLPISFGNLKSQDIVVQMRKDKKNIGGKIQLILPTAIGESKIFNDVSEANVVMILDLDR